MKKIFVFGLLATLVITGCQTELEVEKNDEQKEIAQELSKVFTAVVDDDFSGGTKTSLDGSGNVLWKLGDQVSIFAASTVNEQYQVSDASDGRTSATLNKIPSGGFVAGTDIDNNVAFYPYASTAELAKGGDNYVISEIELPATQTYAAGSFGNGAFPMAAVTSSTEDMNLKFKNVLGGLKLQLKGTATIASISVTGKNNEKLYGYADITVSNGSTPSISLTDVSAKTVTLDCGAGVTLNSETATPFIIALPPITMTEGFTVIVTDTEGKQMEISTSKSQTILRSNLLRMPVVTYEGVAKDYSSNPFTITSIGNTSISIIGIDEGYIPPELPLEYRKGTGSWTTYTMSTVINLVNGETLQFRNSQRYSFFSGEQYYYSIRAEGSGLIQASGNIMSLLSSDMSASLEDNAFRRLFENCSKLVRASGLVLPATTLEWHCYESMFEGCTNLTNAPALPATTLAQNCYSDMFSGCTSLTTPPELPATTLTEGCYANMFSGCTSLTTAPELPATSLTTYGYAGMFHGCTSLTTAPELPATSFAQQCYSYMFGGCTSLTTAPELPSTSLYYLCYQGMFSGCTGLTIAPELPATTLAERCYESMFEGCTSLTTAPNLPATTLAERCYDSMFEGCTGMISVPGLPATKLTYGCYANMFEGCTSLTIAPELPATTLAQSCYSDMFSGCTSLTTPPELPATDNAYYEGMFSGCTSLAIAPELPAVDHIHYGRMFKGCTSLTTAPSLPATSLTYGCYANMFEGCTSLTTAPVLPATNISGECYKGMFKGCTSLASAPALPATWLAGYSSCYESMFEGCTSLTTAPNLPATTLESYCYQKMFYGCTSLNYIKMLATDVSASSCLSNWVYNVAANGTFVKSSSASWDNTGRVPSGWTVQTE